jgi:hypothetical protein
MAFAVLHRVCNTHPIRRRTRDPFSLTYSHLVHTYFAFQHDEQR